MLSALNYLTQYKLVRIGLSFPRPFVVRSLSTVDAQTKFALSKIRRGRWAASTVQCSWAISGREVIGVREHDGSCAHRVFADAGSEGASR